MIPFDEPEHPYWSLGKPKEKKDPLSKARWSKLTSKQVQRIRRLYLKGLEMANKYSVKSFAKKYGVSPGTVRDIVNGRNWRHLL